MSIPLFSIDFCLAINSLTKQNAGKIFMPRKKKKKNLK